MYIQYIQGPFLRLPIFISGVDRGYSALIGRYIRAYDWVAAGTSCGPERGRCELLIG
jgi:hypothetical protein